MKTIIFHLIFNTLIFNSLIFCGEISKNSLEFLRLPSSPRTIALGGVNIGDYNNINVFSNPLVLNSQKGKMLSFSTSLLYEDITSKWLAFSIPTRSSTVGFGIQYIDYGDIYTINSSNIDTGVVKPRDFLVLIGYGINFKNIGLGTNIKYINSKLTNSITTIAIDAGISLNIKKLNLSLNIQNIGKKIKYESEGDPLPTILSFGSWYCFEYFNFGFQYFKNLYSKDTYSFGIEKKIKVTSNTNISLRTGYNSLLKKYSTSEVFSVGLGFNTDNYTIDYSFIPSNILGNVNSFSVSIRF